MSKLKKVNKVILLILFIVIISVLAIYLIASHKTKRIIHVENLGKQGTQHSSSNTQTPDKLRTTGTGFNSPTKNSSNEGSLASPSGTFVSNHQPSLSNSGSPSSEQSICNTSPGAECYIEFIKGNSIIQLPSQSADVSGAVYWSWDVKQADLTVGDWQITAVASQNGQTKSADDSLKLNVLP